MTDEIREFWDQQARIHGVSDLATAPDHYYRELEIDNIIPWIKGKAVLDIGCGNGYSTQKFANAHPAKQFTGVDYSWDMIDTAQSVNDRSNISFKVGDVRKLLLNRKFDTIVSTRCIINLTSWEEQKAALLEMRKALKIGGRLILVENIKDGLDNLNDIRADFGLSPIEQRWHNLYLQLAPFNEFLAEHFKIIHQENIGATYYLLSRVVNAALAMIDGKTPDYNHPINAIAARLPNYVKSNISPNFLTVCKNVPD